VQRYVEGQEELKQATFKFDVKFSSQAKRAACRADSSRLTQLGFLKASNTRTQLTVSVSVSSSVDLVVDIGLDACRVPW
jgi:hypothetical protein